MMCSMTAIAQSDQIRRLIAAAGRAWEKVMNIGFIRIARPPAFDAPELIASKNALSSSGPIRFDCAGHDDLALLRMLDLKPPSAMATDCPDRTPFRIRVD